MQLNRSIPKIETTGIELDEPHFDQEATVLSARPVVPLEELGESSSGTRSGKRVPVILSIVAALLIGGFSATLVYKLRRPQQVTNISEPNNESPQGAPSIEAGVAALSSDLPETANSSEPEETEDPPVIQKANAERPKVAPAEQRPRVLPGNRSDRQRAPSVEEIAEQRQLNRELRRAEKKEERRLRRLERQARQKDGERAGRNSDDLFKIRQIFEGSPRP